MPESREDELSGLDSNPDFNAETRSLPPEKVSLAATTPEVSTEDLPKSFGRYRVISRLGKGGFGAVYRAVDDELQRDVAIKVTLSSLLDPVLRESFLTEARIVASLDHPSIVPVYDVGKTDQGDFYVVSKLIEGSDLAQRIRRDRPNRLLALRIVEQIADALHYSHAKGLVHRDVKPANILLDRQDRPYLTDFGIALRESEQRKKGETVGTPAYMSPEQARGLGHRIDNRSDIYSLGVVLYELLTGRRPFRSENPRELMQLVATEEVRSPRLFEDTITPELERICLKALERRASGRYTVARDFAEEIRLLLAQQLPAPGQRPVLNETPANGTAVTPQTPVTPATIAANSQASDSQRTGPIQVVPKGLRSFDASDASFFLELLPGPFDREGLPESLRFWKTRIEQIDGEQTFKVGLLYGPSGCGKSSLIKAGLLPRLSPKVVPVYVEAGAEETEARLLRGVKKAIPDAEGSSLKEVLSCIRRRRLTPSGGKLLLVLDQFEQWLFAEPDYAKSSLTDALLECDGSTVQAIVMVRDDFWISVSRFLGELDIPLLERENSALVDLFSLEHAAKVLGLFGKAYGKLPDGSKEWSEDQEAFVRQAVEGLSQDGRVISVRIAILAEMLRSRVWTTAALHELGGVEGVGEAFLEEMFGARHAPLQHRRHQTAVRGLLAALLPAVGSDIKGAKRSVAELQGAAGYRQQPREFAELLGILDKNLRLITPVDAEDRGTIVPNLAEVKKSSVGKARSAGAAEQLGQLLYYQLAHDYLVPSLREWLTRKQRETKKGRTELKLAERTAAWSALRETRQLPTLGEWLRIQFLTERAKWKPAEQRLMRAASVLNLLKLVFVSLATCGLVWFTGPLILNQLLSPYQTDIIASVLVDKLRSTEITGVPDAVADLETARPLVNQKLAAALEQTQVDSVEHLNLSLGLLGHDPAAFKYVAERLPLSEPLQVPVLVTMLEPFKEQLLPQLWSRAQEGNAKTLLPVASALAAYDPESEHWRAIAPEVARQLVRENSLVAGAWTKMLRPAAECLRAPLEVLYREQAPAEEAQSRLRAAETLGDYLSDNPAGLFELLVDGSLRQFALLADRLASHEDEAVMLAAAEVAKPARESASESFKEKLALRQANAGALLLRLGAAEAVWPLLRHSPDPRARSYLIHALVARGVTPGGLIERYRSQPSPEISERRALLLCLGEYPRKQLDPAELEEFVSLLKSDYQRDPDPGLHASAEWLLRQWGEQKWLEDWLTAQAKQREPQAAAGSPPGDADPRQWYVNSQGQTFAILDAGEFQMGSPDREAGRQPDETRHRRRIGRRVAIATSEVTRTQWKLFYSETKVGFDPDDTQLKEFSPKADCPMVAITWYAAAAYCNWLSKQEGIPPEQWCYEPNESGEYAEGMKVKEKFWELSGYRLPTEAEWEYACRAGAETAFSFGGTPELLERYGWFVQNADNRTHGVGQTKPNDFGLFDLHGNAWEWCHDVYGAYPGANAGLEYGLPAGVGKATVDQPEDGGKPVDTERERVLRGGAFILQAESSRASARNHYRPDVRNVNYGFRPSRTYPLSR